MYKSLGVGGVCCFSLHVVTQSFTKTFLQCTQIAIAIKIKIKITIAITITIKVTITIIITIKVTITFTPDGQSVVQFDSRASVGHEHVVITAADTCSDWVCHANVSCSSGGSPTAFSST